MFEKPRKIDSLDTLQNYLSEKGGTAPGIYYETEVERDENGEIVMEDEHPVKGDFGLITDPEAKETSLIFFQSRETKDAPSVTISALDVTTGSVKVLARRKVK